MITVQIPFEWCGIGFDKSQKRFLLDRLLIGRRHVLEQYNCKLIFEPTELIKHQQNGSSFPYISRHPYLAFETEADAVLFKLTEL